MKPLVMETKNLDDDLSISTLKSSSDYIKEAIRKEVPDVHPVIEQLVIGAASTASTLSSAFPILEDQLSGPYVEVLDRLVELLINNTIAAIYAAAKALDYSPEDTGKALQAGGTAGFNIVREIRAAAHEASTGDRTLN